MQLHEMLKELSERLNIPALYPSENNELTLAFDEVVVSLEHRSQSLLLISKLSALPTMKEAYIYEFLLSMSVLGKLDVYVGMQKENNILTCVSHLDEYSLTCDVLEQRLENHVHVVECLREAIVELQQNDVDTKNPEHFAIRI